MRSILNQHSKVDFSQFLFFLILIGLLSTFILSPVLQVLYVAFTQDGSITLFHFLSFFQRALFREAFLNSLFAGVMVVIFSSLIALPLVFFSVRYDFKGKVCGRIPVLRFESFVILQRFSFTPPLFTLMRVGFQDRYSVTNFT